MLECLPDMIESDQVPPRASTLDAIRSMRGGENVRLISDEDQGHGVMIRPKLEAGP